MPHLCHLHDGARDGASACSRCPSTHIAIHRPQSPVRSFENCSIELQCSDSVTHFHPLVIMPNSKLFQASQGVKAPTSTFAQLCINPCHRILQKERLFATSFHLEQIIACMQTYRTTHQRCFDSEFCKSFAGTLISKSLFSTI
jgi:hypothetical protein